MEEIKMEDLKTKLDLYLTEVSMELLGNKIYDISGKRQTKVLELFKAVPENKVEEKYENSNDVMCRLGYEQGFTEDADSMLDFMEDQMDFTLIDANSNQKTNQAIISFLKNYKSDQDQLLKDVSEMHVKKLVERSKITSNLNKARMNVSQKSTITNEKHKLVKKYYEVERDQLLKSCVNIQRLIKCIINDTEDDVERGEMIGFVHAIRSIRDCENQGKQNGHKVLKPYKR